MQQDAAKEQRTFFDMGLHQAEVQGSGAAQGGGEDFVDLTALAPILGSGERGKGRSLGPRAQAGEQGAGAGAGGAEVVGWQADGGVLK
eukprot:1149173-Pelagomonas_calceolata.AAC.3